MCIPASSYTSDAFNNRFCVDYFIYANTGGTYRFGINAVTGDAANVISTLEGYYYSKIDKVHTVYSCKSFEIKLNSGNNVKTNDGGVVSLEADYSSRYAWTGWLKLSHGFSGAGIATDHYITNLWLLK